MSAFTEEQIAELKAILTPAPAAEPTAEQVTQDRVSQVGKPDIDPEAGPEFYIHLANGEVVKSFDSGNSHVPDSKGISQLVIGRYPVGE